MPLVVLTFYHFVNLPNCEQVRTSLLELGRSLELKGMILLAKEGVNATITGPREQIDSFHDWFRVDPRFDGMQVKESQCPTMPFKRFTVKIKEEIVRSRMDIAGRCCLEGSHVNPEQWDELVADPETVVLDVRNDFEVRLGAFKGAVNPGIEKFSDLTEWTQENLDPKKNRRVAMYCTGGIRCEKAAVWFKQQGFEEVNQLEGGILNYLKHRGDASGNWEGDCFVFDHRIAVDANLQATYSPMCCYCQNVLPELTDDCPHCGRDLSQHNKNYQGFRPEE